MRASDLRIAFFGSPEFAVSVLEELSEVGFTPALVVTQPDKPKGRALELAPTPVKIWATERDIDVIEPKSLKGDDPALTQLLNSEWDLFIVAAYGLIIPKRLLELPKYKTLNVHPSLLPKLRGASPVRTAILTDQRDAVGVSIMRLDEQMDHGPILAQASLEPDPWPVGAPMLEDTLAHEGGKLLVEAIPLWIQGELPEEPQDDSQATFCDKITKAMGEIDLHGNAYENYRKILALEGWPGTYFFIQKRGKPFRVKIVEAEYGLDGELHILRVIPEGKREMSYHDFLLGVKREEKQN